MYLIHAELRAPAPGAALGADPARALLAAALPAERIEHVVVHEGTGPGAVLGVYVIAERLAEAESAVAGFCRRALPTLPAFGGWTVLRVGAPLVAPFYERLLSGTGPAGRNRSLPFPSI
ncbi:hypothetical protein [Streptomyces rubellomurinus]|uniref:YCII-related domain-containing protein n=1 Tax=Streptomyces sp. Y1 TaxID=3238634 RepID=A0AB39TP31_9ACTN|nr:hypothetical protein [Streptomyces rubellomurinus]